MAVPIPPVPPITLADPSTSVNAPSVFPAAGEQANGNNFQSMFHSAVNTVEASSDASDKAVEDFLSGNTEDVHSTALAVQRADLTFEMFMQVRNKVVSAYQEVMKMQV